MIFKQLFDKETTVFESKAMTLDQQLILLQEDTLALSIKIQRFSVGTTRVICCGSFEVVCNWQANSNRYSGNLLGIDESSNAASA